MKKNFNFPFSWRKNIISIDGLAKELEYPASKLILISSQANKYFYEKKLENRTLSIPKKELKIIQKKILKNLLNIVFDNHVHGGTPKRSITTNALQHRKKDWVACIDIKSFFPSSHYSNIERVFICLGISEEIAKILTHLTTYKHELPQGAPTSPTLANLLSFNLDNRIANLCKKLNFCYTRYFDDITISGKQNPKKFIEKIKEIIKQEGYRMHDKPEKLKIQHKSKEQLVTGIIVNDFNLRLPQKNIMGAEKLREELTWIKNGIFSDKFIENPEQRRNVIRGKIEFLKRFEKQIYDDLIDVYKDIKWPHLE